MEDNSSNGPTGKHYRFPKEIFKEVSFLDHSQKAAFEKNETLTEEVMHHKNMSIIQSGIVILYWENKDGTRTIIDFKSAGEVLRPAVEISEGRVGKIYAQSYTESEILMINREFMCTCTFESEAISNFFYGKLTEDISSTYRQLKLLKEADLEKRYEIFLNEYKHIYNEISDRMIASFLGVHYTTLSRVKSRLLLKSKAEVL